MRKKFILSLLFLFSTNQLFPYTIRPIDMVYGTIIAGIAWKFIIVELLKIPSAFTLYFARYLNCYHLISNAIKADQKEALLSLLGTVTDKEYHTLIYLSFEEKDLLFEKAIKKNNAYALDLMLNTKHFYNSDITQSHLVTACQAQSTQSISALCKYVTSNRIYFHLPDDDRHIICNYLENLIETSNPVAEELFSLLCRERYVYEWSLKKMIDTNNTTLLKYFIMKQASHYHSHDDKFKNCFISACHAQSTEIISLLCNTTVNYQNSSPDTNRFFDKTDFSVVYNYLKNQVENNNQDIIYSIFNWLEKNNLSYLDFATYIIKKQSTFRTTFSKIILEHLVSTTANKHYLKYISDKEKLLKTILTISCEANNKEILFLLKGNIMLQLRYLEEKENIIIIDYLNSLCIQKNNSTLTLHILSLFSSATNIQLELWWMALQKNFSQLADTIKTYYKLSLKTQNMYGKTVFHAAVNAPFADTILQSLIEEDCRTNTNLYAINIPTKRGKTPLHLIVDKEEKSKQNNVLLERVLTHCGIKLNTKDKEGRTPLIYAAHWGNKDAVNTLLTCKSIEPHIKSKTKCSFFYSLFCSTRSRQGDSYDNMQIEAMPYFEKMENQDRQSFMNTELRSILFMQQATIDTDNASRFIDCCIELGANPNTRDTNGKRPVDIAKEQWPTFKKISSNPKFIKLFIQQEQLYHLFLRKTPIISDKELRNRLENTNKLPGDVSNHILQYYHQLNIQYYVAIYASKNSDYYKQSQQKKSIQNQILQKIYEKR